MSTHQPHSPDNPLVHHEESDVDIAGILKFGAGLVVLAAAVHVLVWGLLLRLDRTQAITTTDFPIAAGETRTPPGPQLQVTPREDMRALVAEDDATLSSYRWVDREQGVVRIPIDVAMRLTLERGLPARGADGSTGNAAGGGVAGGPTGAPQP